MPHHRDISCLVVTHKKFYSKHMHGAKKLFFSSKKVGFYLLFPLRIAKTIQELKLQKWKKSPLYCFLSGMF